MLTINKFFYPEGKQRRAGQWASLVNLLRSQLIYPELAQASHLKMPLETETEKAMVWVSGHFPHMHMTQALLL